LKPEIEVKELKLPLVDNRAVLRVAAQIILEVMPNAETPEDAENEKNCREAMDKIVAETQMPADFLACIMVAGVVHSHQARTKKSLEEAMGGLVPTGTPMGHA